MFTSKNDGFSMMSSVDVNTNISKLIEIFKLLSDKDLFENHYREALAKRILKVD
jgi:hypothetical protein